MQLSPKSHRSNQTTYMLALCLKPPAELSWDLAGWSLCGVFGEGTKTGRGANTWQRSGGRVCTNPWHHRGDKFGCGTKEERKEEGTERNTVSNWFLVKKNPHTLASCCVTQIRSCCVAATTTATPTTTLFISLRKICCWNKVKEQSFFLCTWTESKRVVPSPLEEEPTVLTRTWATSLEFHMQHFLRSVRHIVFHGACLQASVPPS